MWCGVSTAEPRVWCEGSREEPRVWCEGSREEPGVCGVRGPQRSLVCVCGLGVSTAERRVWGVRGPQQSLVFGVRTLKSLLQHHSSKASILWHSAFFTVQLSHPCMTTGKTIALTRRTFVGKVMSLLLKTLSRLVITFLPRSKASFNFMAVITICSDSGAPKK